MGVDGISMLFVLLTTLLTPLCILASWESITVRVKEYMIAFLVMETMMVGTFCALDLILFYLFFESVLIPMFLIIGIWGGPRRIYSAFKFFLFTFAGSVLMFLALLTMYFQAGTTDIPTLMQHDFPTAAADLAVARGARRVRGQAADVAGAYMAAGRPRRGSDGRIGHPRRRAAEVRRLRVPAVLAADAAGSVGRVHAADVRPRHHRHHLYLPGRAGPGGHEEAHRLFLGRAHGLRHDRHLYPDRAGDPGLAVPDAEPRHRLRRPVPRRRASSTTGSTRARSRSTAVSSSACRPTPWCS